MHRTPSPLSGLPDLGGRWRRTLLMTIPIAGLAFAIGMVLDPVSGQSTPFDRLAYPLLIAGVCALEFALWRWRHATAAVVTGLVLLSGSFFLCKLIYLLFFLPAFLSVQTEMTESFFWIPAVYVLSLFVPNLRAARNIVVAFFGAMVLCAVAYAAGDVWTGESVGVIFALTQLILANLTLLCLTYVFIGYKDLLSGAQARAETLQRMVHTDLLTGLPSRQRFEEELDLLTGRGEAFSLLFIDVDGFKLVNDTLGHSAGDDALREFAGRLELFLGGGDLAARISGDEFVMIFRGTPPGRALGLAHHILDSVNRPFVVRGQQVQLTASIGLSAFPEDAQDSEAVLRHADAAMYHVKSSGKNGVRRFDGALDAELERRKVLEREFQFALQRGQLSVVYQPIFHLPSGEVHKAEVLLRWTHPEFGAVPPGIFIAMAESSGQIIQVGGWVLDTACAQARRWRELLGQPLVVTVNVSPVQFLQPSFVSQVKNALLRSGLPASALELELTEGAVMQRPSTVRAALHDLRQLGVSIAIDDFGTGYSSLSYLRDLPINSIKIDRSFIQDLATPRRAPQYAVALVEAIVGIARTLDLQVVAEGIESSGQLELVRSFGCDFAQGYHFARPMEAQALTDLLHHDVTAGEIPPHIRLN